MATLNRVTFRDVIRAVVTLMIIAAALYTAIALDHTPEELKILAVAVVGYWFGVGDTALSNGRAKK